MLALESLVFSANTDELEKAVGKIDALTTAVKALSKAQSEEVTAAMQAEKLKREEAKTALALIKAEDQIATAKQKKLSATKEAVSEDEKANKVLQRQKEMLEFMTQGFSRGQASTLAYAKATGAAADEIRELGNVLNVQRKLIGGDVFDKSLSGLTALKNQLGEVREAYRQYNSDVDLTRNQTRELARDKERIIERLKQEGASFTDIKQAIREHGEAYIATAAKVNALIAVEKERERQQRETANAIRAVAAEEERMASVIKSMSADNTNMASATEKSAQAVAKYERNLRLAGVSADEASKKLALYRQQVMKVQEADQDRRAQHLARSLTPQIADVVTSLAGGMPLHLIIMQQGLQIRDMVSMAGVETKKLQEVFRTASADMIKSLAGTAQAIGTLLIGSIVSAGQAIANGFITPIKEAGLAFRAFATGDVEAIEYLPEVFNRSAEAISASAKIIGDVLLGAITAVTTAFLYLDTQQTKLSNSLNLYGASLGTTTQQALEMAVQSEYATETIVEAISAVAKAGGFTQEQLKTVTESAARMNNVFGSSVDEVVEKYSNLRKDPVKALLELQAQTGQVNTSVLENIRSLVKQGDTYGAIRVAVDEYADALSRTADDAEETSGKTADFIRLIKEYWNSLFKDLQQWALIAAQNIAYVFNAIGETIGGTVAMAVQAAKGNFTGASAIWDDMGKRADENRVRIDALNNSLLGKTGESSLISGVREELVAVNKELEEIRQKEKSGEKGFFDLIAGDKGGELLDQKKALEERISFLQKIQKETTDALSPQGKSSTQANSELAQWQLKNEETFKKAISDKEEYNAEMKRLDAEYAEGQRLGASAEELEKIRAAQAKLTEEFNKKGSSAKAAGDSLRSYESALESFQDMQAKAIGKTEEQTAAQAKLESVMRSSDWNKYSEAQKQVLINEAQLAHNAQLAAKAFEEEAKALEKLQDLFDDMDMSNLETSKEIEKQNAELAFQYSLLGKTDDQVKDITRAHQLQSRILEINTRYDLERIDLAKKYNEELAKVNDPLERFVAEQTYNDNLYKMRLNQEKELANAGKQAQLAALQEYDAEFRRIQGELSEVIWIAMSEGGKKGAEALGDLLEDELKKIAMKPINIMVNFLMNAVEGMLGFGPSGGGQGGVGSMGSMSMDLLSSLGDIGSSLLSGATSLSDIASAFTSGSVIGTSTMAEAQAAQLGASGMGGTVAGVLGGIGGSLLFGGKGQSGMGGSIGSSIGMTVGGPVGAIVGTVIGSALGSLLEKKPSNKAAWGEVNLSTGETANLGNMTGKKQASQQTLTARDQLLQSFFGMAESIRKAGGALSIDNVKLDVGERDGIKVDFGEGMESMGKDAEVALNKIAAKLLEDAYGSFTDEQKAIVDSLKDDSLKALNLINIAANGLIEFTSPLETFSTASSKLGDKFKELGIEMPTSIAEFNLLAESLDLTTTAGQDLALGMQELIPEFAALQLAAAEMLGLSTESIKSLFNTVLQEATTADEARKMAAEGAEAMIYEGLGNMLIDQVSSMVMDGIVGPMSMQLVNAAASSAALTTTGATVAASNMATGGAIGGANVATGGAMGGSAVAQGGATAANYLASVVSQAKATIGAFTSILKDPEIQALIAEAGMAIGEIGSAMFSSGAFKTPSVGGGGGGGGSSGGGGGGGGGSSETKDPLQEAYDLLIKTIAKEKQLAKERLDSINKIYEISINAAKKLYGEVDSTVKQTYAQSRQFFNESVQSIMQGVMPDAEEYKDAVDNLMKEISDTAYATKTDADRARLLLANELQSVADQLEPEKTALEQQLEYLESLEKTAKEQLDALKGNTEATITLVEAIAKWQGISGLVLPAFATGGSYQGGMALVGEEGPELINFSNPGQIYTAGQTASMLQGSATELTKELIYEVQMLRAEVRADVGHNAKTAKILDRVVPDGRSIAVTASVDGGTL